MRRSQWSGLAVGCAGLVWAMPVFAVGQTEASRPPCIKHDAASLDAFLKDWNAALVSGSTDRLLALYAADAVVVAAGSTLAVTGLDKLKIHYRRLLPQPMQAHFGEVVTRFDCNQTILAGTYALLPARVVPVLGKPSPLRFRMDIAFRDGRWQVTQHQSSYPALDSEHSVKMAALRRQTTPVAGAVVPVAATVPRREQTTTGGGLFGDYKAGSWSDAGPKF